MATIAVTDHPFPDLHVAREILEGAGHTVVEHRCTTADEAAEACADAEGVLNTYVPMPGATLDALRHCRAVARFGIGVDTIDLERATQLGIVVTNVPDYCIQEVTAHTLALLLAAHRRVVQFDRRIREGVWDVNGAGPIRRLAGSRLGLIGAGRIPRSVAAAAMGLGLRVAGFDPFLAEEAWPAGIERRSSLEELAAESDFLSVHAPATPANHHLVDAALLRLMPSHGVLINTARGPVVDSEALAQALREGWIGGAALDVLESEPPAPDHPLRGFDNVLLTPHAAFYSEESLRELQSKAAEQLRAALAGERPVYLVNQAVMDRARPPG